MLTEDRLFLKNHEIQNIRFGIENIRGFEFNIGRLYEVFLKDEHSKVMKIAFSSLYGYQRTNRDELYIELLNSLWNSFFEEKYNFFMNAFEQAISFQIGYVLFNPIGIEILNPIFKSKSNLRIKWEDLQTEDYVSNFTVMDKHQVIHINRSFSYLKDWDTLLLKSVVRSILNNKNLEKKSVF